MTARFSTALVALLLVAGCAFFVPSYEYTGGYLSPQPLGTIEQPVRMRHRLTVDFGPRAVTFRTVFEISADRATFVLLNPMGGRALSVTQKGKNLKVERVTERQFPIDPRRLYVDLQMMIWPELDLRSPYSVRETTDGETTRVRWLMRGGNKYGKISLPVSDSFGGERTFSHLEATYRLKLETLHVKFPRDQH